MNILRKSVSVLLRLTLGLSVITANAAQVPQITVYSSGALEIGSSRQLTAYVPLSPNTVTWSVNGEVGGNAVYGKVSGSGLYQAPTVVPANNAVLVRATSTAYPDKSGVVRLTITQPAVHLWSSSPQTVPAGSFSIKLNGANFNPGSVVYFGGTPLATTWVSATELRASGAATLAQVGSKVPVIVKNSGLGGTTSETVLLAITAASPVVVTVSPASATVGIGGTRQFSASVSGTTNTAVSWRVNDVPGGNATLGTITSAGLYTAPASAPNPATVYVRAMSAANIAVSGAAAVTVQASAPTPVPPLTVAVNPTAATLLVGTQQQFSATVSGSTNAAVNWSVNNVTGGNSSVGTISSAGLYTAPAIVPSPASVSVRATSVANPNSGATAVVTISAGVGAGQGTANLAAGRFLEQAAFGPTPAELAKVERVGMRAWLTEQYGMPETPIVDPGGSGNGLVQSQYVSRLSLAPDQLRQKVAYALGQIIVISINKNNYPDEVVPYLQILSRNAFGNYRTLLGEIAVSPQMGKYLDLANSNKPNGVSSANENFARELMQLFTIGLVQLNLDGSTQVDAAGRAVPSYDRTTVPQMALALTGWTYAGPQANNWENFSGPMVPHDVNHDMRQKTFLSCSLSPGQTTVADMNSTLDCLFKHPNVGPFVVTRLIRSMVTSNPSPAYIQRVASVFNNNGAGVRGDLRAVVDAILMDAEARNDVTNQSAGRLKDPIGHTVALVRAFGGSISPTNGESWAFGQLGQAPLAPPSVFSFYSPLFHIPQSTLFGPEFQIYTPTEAVLRGNLFWHILSNPGSDFALDLSPYVAVANNTTALIDAVDQTLLYGRMPPAMRQSLATAITAQGDASSKALTALYLTALSGLYATQY